MFWPNTQKTYENKTKQQQQQNKQKKKKKRVEVMSSTTEANTQRISSSFSPRRTSPGRFKKT